MFTKCLMVQRGPGGRGVAVTSIWPWRRKEIDT